MAHRKKRIVRIGRILVLFAIAAGIAAAVFYGFHLIHTRNQKQEAAQVSPSSQPSATPSASAEPTYDPSLFTDTDSLLLIANKSHRLPEGYEPSDLVDVNTLGGHGNIAPMMRKKAAEAEAEMTAAAAEDGIYLQFSSAYRSEEYQSELYWGYVASDGQEAADTYSSRPGYSDHQTGLAADFVENGSSDFTAGFENTESGKWLYEHAWEYGFVIRYPKGKDEITGYTYEPWHYRYIGKDWAAKLHAVSPDETIEEYFGVSGGTEYTDPISTPAS